MTSIDRTWASPGSPEPTRSPQELARRLLGEIDTLDCAIYDVLAHTPTPTLDVPMTWISNAANYSRISIAIASALAVAGGELESVTRTVKLEMPAPLGAPVIAPVLLFKLKPIGKLPAVTLQE